MFWEVHNFFKVDRTIPVNVHQGKVGVPQVPLLSHGDEIETL